MNHLLLLFQRAAAMTQYILRRLIQAIPLFFITSLIIFVLLRSAGDPLATLGERDRTRPADKARLRVELGLDQPVFVQYLTWLMGNDWMRWDTDGDNISDHAFILPLDGDGDGEPERPGKRRGVLRGDFGASSVTRQPAMEIIVERIPNTLLLMVTAEIVTLVFALIVGVYAALRQYSWVDNLITGFSFVTFSIPIFLLAIGLMYLFAVQFRQWGLFYFPTVSTPSDAENLGELMWHMTLPVATISLVGVAGYSRFIRSNMLEVINSDFIRTARAKGITERAILFRHAFKNAALPLATLIGLDLPTLLAGAVVTESIFAWPGMGRLFIDHLARLDYPVIMGLMMLITLAVVVFQLLTDIVYTWLDPRIRYA